MNKLIIDHLRKLGTREIKPVHNRQGICRELEVKFDFCIKQKDFIGWDKFSGNFANPVPHPYFHDHMEAYAGHKIIIGNQWLDDEYGNNRRDLCLYLADLYTDRMMSCQ